MDIVCVCVCVASYDVPSGRPSGTRQSTQLRPSRAYSWQRTSSSSVFVNAACARIFVAAVQPTMAYMATRVDGTNPTTGRSTFSAAGQSMMSPRLDMGATGTPQRNPPPVYPSTNPYPGASSRIEMQYPGGGSENIYANDTPPIGTLRGAGPLQSGGSDFVQITPRTRRERSTAQDNDAVVRANLQSEHARHYRSVALAENNNFARAFTVDQTAPLAGNLEDRYKGNSHELLKSQNDAKIAARKEFLDQKRMNVMSEEQRRWEQDNSQADGSDARWDEIRASSLKAKSNLNSLPYNPISLQTKDSADGLQYEYEEGLMTYRAALRSKNLYGRYNANGFNPINGTELWDVSMPERPMQPAEVMVAQEALQKLDAVKQIKQALYEIRGDEAVRIAAAELRKVCDQSTGALDRGALAAGLQATGITVNMAQLQNVMTVFDTGNTGAIFVEDLLGSLRGVMSERRKALVGMTWQQLDLNNEGVISVATMLAKYDVSMRDDIVEGRTTREQAVGDFLRSWGKTEEDRVAWEEFYEYYADMGAFVDSDDQFDGLVRRCWRLPGGYTSFASTTRLRVLVLHKSGDWTIEEVPGGPMANNLRGSALMAEIKRRFRDDGRLFLEIKLNDQQQN